jgi:hypothetical protein
MDNKPKNSNFDEFNSQRIEIAERMMGILDEDGQPMYNEEWINEHILGITQEKEKPE